MQSKKRNKATKPTQPSCFCGCMCMVAAVVVRVTICVWAYAADRTCMDYVDRGTGRRTMKRETLLRSKNHKTGLTLNSPHIRSPQQQQQHCQYW